MKNSGLIAWFLANPIAAGLATLFILCAGLASAYSIGKQYEPVQPSKLISISTHYPGASPQEVEDAVLAKMEEAIRPLPGIRSFSSEARYGSGTLLLEAKDPSALQALLDEVQLRISSLSAFPQDVEKPQIEVVRNWRRVMFVQIYGDMDQATVKEVTKQIRDEIAALPGIGRAHIPWLARYEVVIEVQPLQLQKYQLSLAGIAQQVEAASGNIGAGLLRSSAGDLQIRAATQAYSPDDFAAIALRQLPDGTVLRLGDVATIRNGFEEKGAFFGYNGQAGEAISVESIDDQNDITIAATVRQYLEQKRRQLPAEIKLDVWSDNSYYLSSRLGLLVANLLSGALLIFVFISLVLSPRSAVWVVVSLLTCIGATLALMQLPWFGRLTINMYSLFGFILVLGILVDDAIVVCESVSAEAGVSGCQDRKTVLRGTRKVAVPATFGVLTTMLAFVPMLFLHGELAQMWHTIGMVVIVALAMSILDSKCLLPAHLVRAAPPKAPGPLRRTVARAIERLREQYYLPLLCSLLQHRWTALTIACAVLLLSAALLHAGHIRTLLWPAVPSDFIQVNIQGEVGLPNQQVHQLVQHFSARLQQLDAQLKTESGQSVVQNQLYWRQGDSGAGMFIELSKSEVRSISTAEVIQRWRALAGRPAGLKNVSMDAASSTAGPNLALTLTAADSQILQQGAEQLRRQLALQPGVQDVYDSMQSGSEQIELQLKPLAQSLGLTVAEVARQVRAAVHGIEVQRLIKNAEETRVMVRYPAHARKEVSDLASLQIQLSNGRQVPFQLVADLQLSNSVAQIQRLNGQRAVTISAYIDPQQISPDQVMQRLQTEILPELQRNLPGLGTELSGASRETAELLHQLAWSAALVLILIYAALAIPLQSYSRPLLVLAVLPFAMTGAVLGHAVLQLDLSLLSLLGVLALCGVVVNDGLLLLDNLRQQPAAPLQQQLMQACRERFRSCLLTSVTTILGLFPIIFETSQQAQFVIPMAVSVCFGLMLSTLVTLLLLPALVLALADIRRAVRPVPVVTVEQ